MITLMKNLFITLLLLMSVGCLKKEPVKIGFLAGLSNGSTSLGLEGKNGFLLALDDVNENSHKHGYTFNAVVKDHALDYEKSYILIDEFKREGVQVIVGPMVSAVAMNIIEYLNKHKVLAISPTVSTNDLGDREDYFFRVYPASKDNAKETAIYARETCRVKDLTIVLDKSNASHTESFSLVFSKYFLSAGHRISSIISYHGKRDDLSQVAQRIPKSSDGVLILSNDRDTAVLLQELHKSGQKRAIFVSEWSITKELFTNAKDLIEGVTLFATMNEQHSDPSYLSFKERYRKKYGSDPTFASVLAYDSAMIVMETMTSGLKESDLKRGILNQGSYKTLLGEVSFDRYGDIVRSLFPTTIKDGKLTRIE